MKTPLDIIDQLEPRHSPYRDWSFLSVRRRWLNWIQREARFEVVVVLLYSLAMILPTRGRLRWGFCRISILALVALVATAFAEPVSSLIWAGDHRYVYDYTYVPVSDWSPSDDDWHTIIAYEKGPVVFGAARWVAVKTGHVFDSSPEEFEAFVATGRFEPSPPLSTSRGAAQP